MHLKRHQLKITYLNQLFMLRETKSDHTEDGRNCRDSNKHITLIDDGSDEKNRQDDCEVVGLVVQQIGNNAVFPLLQIGKIGLLK
jgi:hypothetical protein